MRRIILRFWILVVVAFAMSLTANAGDDARVRVGLAWQPTDAAYDRVVLSIEAAGGEAVICPRCDPLELTMMAW